MKLHHDYIDSLVTVSRTLLSFKNPDSLFKEILDISMKTLKAERGFLAYSDPEEKKVRFRTFSSDQESLDDLTEISQGVVDMVLNTGEPLLTKNASTDPRFSGRKSVILHGIRSVACVPLKQGDDAKGVIYMDSRGQQDLFTWDTINYLTLVASYAALAIDNALDFDTLKAENLRLAGEVHRSYGFEGIIGESRAMKRVFDIMARVLDTDLPVLITGESGTGKELVSRALHYNSYRKNKPFLALFCGNLAPELLESELFGHVKGAFTGAISNKTGLVEQAEGGTLLLDEIADLPATIQAKLLRFLQESEYRPVGGNTTKKVNVRILTATNKDMQQEVADKNFRADLYWRLKVLTVHIPPLAERRGDIPLLVAYFLKKYGTRAGKDNLSISRDAIKLFENHPWPGNIRELENAVARAVVFTQGDRITKDILLLEDYDFGFKKTLDEENDPSLKGAIKRHALKTINLCNGNRSEAVRRLGISRRYLYNLIEELKEEGINL